MLNFHIQKITNSCQVLPFFHHVSILKSSYLEDNIELSFWKTLPLLFLSITATIVRISDCLDQQYTKTSIFPILATVFHNWCLVFFPAKFERKNSSKRPIKCNHYAKVHMEKTNTIKRLTLPIQKNIHQRHFFCLCKFCRCCSEFIWVINLKWRMRLWHAPAILIWQLCTEVLFLGNPTKDKPTEMKEQK